MGAKGGQVEWCRIESESAGVRVTVTNRGMCIQQGAAHSARGSCSWNVSHSAS